MTHDQFARVSVEMPEIDATKGTAFELKQNPGY